MGQESGSSAVGSSGRPRGAARAGESDAAPATRSCDHSRASSGVARSPPANSARCPATFEAPVSVADERIEDTSDMRKFLLKQMVRAARGEITTETVKNIVTLSQQVYNATSLELKAATILKDSERSIRALELVSPQDADR